MKPTSTYTPGVGWHVPGDDLVVTYTYYKVGLTRREIEDVMVQNLGSYLIEFGLAEIGRCPTSAT